MNVGAYWCPADVDKSPPKDEAVARLVHLLRPPSHNSVHPSAQVVTGLPGGQARTAPTRNHGHKYVGRNIHVCMYVCMCVGR